jgi:hypothetical protein
MKKLLILVTLFSAMTSDDLEAKYIKCINDNFGSIEKELRFNRRR